MTIAGSTSTRKLPPTGARAKSTSPAATIAMPIVIGARRPKRITSRADRPSENAAMISVAGRNARPTSSEE